MHINCKIQEIIKKAYELATVYLGTLEKHRQFYSDDLKFDLKLARKRTGVHLRSSEEGITLLMTGFFFCYIICTALNYAMSACPLNPTPFYFFPNKQPPRYEVRGRSTHTHNCCYASVIRITFIQS